MPGASHPLEHISLRCNLLRSSHVLRLVGVFCSVEVLQSVDLSAMGVRKSVVNDLKERLRYKRTRVDFDTPVAEIDQSGVYTDACFGLPALGEF